jgi:ABC-type proline/glycine betaine transport system permease subunit
MFDRFRQRQLPTAEKQMKQIRRLADRFVDLRQTTPSVPIFGIFVPFSIFVFHYTTIFNPYTIVNFPLIENARKPLAVFPTSGLRVT